MVIGAENSGDGGGSGGRRGASFAQISMAPEPLGGTAADWYYSRQNGIGVIVSGGGGGGGDASAPSWSDIFRTDSTVTYTLGDSPGRAPWGGEYVTLTFDQTLQRWVQDQRALFQPQRLLPGFWHPCADTPLTLATSAARQQCDCSPVPSAFANYSGTEGGLMRWEEVRKQAYLEGGRILGDGGALLNQFAGSSYDTTTTTAPASTRVLLWSRFMLLGTASMQPDVCTWLNQKNNNGGAGPCFPLIKHYQQRSLADLQALAQLPKVRLVYPPPSPPSPGGGGGGTWPTGTNLVCATGWPAHYSCPSGYTWVGPNTSALAPDQLFLMDDSAGRGGGPPPLVLTGQIACLSCLPGSFSMVTAAARANKHTFAGGPYRCTPCEFGMYAAGVASQACTPCPSGTFANRSGSSACTACPLNHFTSSGATDSSMCSPCPPGTGNCNDCVAGEYQDQAAQLVCHPCPPGTFSDTANQSVCTPCPPGQYQANGGQARCLQCPPSTHPPFHRGWCWWRGGGGDCMRALPCPHVPHSHQWGVRPGLRPQLLLRLRPMGPFFLLLFAYYYHRRRRQQQQKQPVVRALPQRNPQPLPQMRQCADRVPGRCTGTLRRASTLRRRHRRRDTAMPTRQGTEPRAHGLHPLPPRSVRHQWQRMHAVRGRHILSAGGRQSMRAVRPGQVHTGPAAFGRLLHVRLRGGGGQVRPPRARRLSAVRSRHICPRHRGRVAVHAVPRWHLRRACGDGGVPNVHPRQVRHPQWQLHPLQDRVRWLGRVLQWSRCHRLRVLRRGVGRRRRANVRGVRPGAL
jgi:hypothetical protein